MKILFVNKFFHMNGGSERVFFQERNFLIKDGHTVIDFSMGDGRNFHSPYSVYFVPNISYHGHRRIQSKLHDAVSFIHSSIAVKNLEILIKRERPEIAHLHNIYHQLTPSIITLLKKYGVKVVMTLHDYKLICPGYLALHGDEICTKCNGSQFYQTVKTHCQGSYGKEMLLMIEAYWHKWKHSYEGVDCFISPSQFLADLASARISPNKLVVLRNGIDLIQYRSALKDKQYVLFLGRLSKEKGIETLLHAYRKRKTGIPLNVVGTGPLERTLTHQYPEVRFLGFKKGQNLKTLISEASFVVVPSEWYENCSMVVLETMAMGKPVIGSRVGGIPEQIEDGKTGFLFEMGSVDDLNEKMHLLWTNPKMRMNMGMAARKKVEKDFSLEQHCNNLMKIYTKLLPY